MKFKSIILIGLACVCLFLIFNMNVDASEYTYTEDFEDDSTGDWNNNIKPDEVWYNASSWIWTNDGDGLSVKTDRIDIVYSVHSIDNNSIHFQPDYSTEYAEGCSFNLSSNKPVEINYFNFSIYINCYPDTGRYLHLKFYDDNISFTTIMFRQTGEIYTRPNGVVSDTGYKWAENNRYNFSIHFNFSSKTKTIFLNGAEIVTNEDMRVSTATGLTSFSFQSGGNEAYEWFDCFIDEIEIGSSVPIGSITEDYQNYFIGTLNITKYVGGSVTGGIKSIENNFTSDINSLIFNFTGFNASKTIPITLYWLNGYSPENHYFPVTGTYNLTQYISHQDLDVGEELIFWVKCHVPNNLSSGTYFSNSSFEGNDGLCLFYINMTITVNLNETSGDYGNAPLVNITYPVNYAINLSYESINVTYNVSDDDNNTDIILYLYDVDSSQILKQIHYRNNTANGSYYHVFSNLDYGTEYKLYLTGSDAYYTSTDTVFFNTTPISSYFWHGSCVVSDTEFSQTLSDNEYYFKNTFNGTITDLTFVFDAFEFDGSIRMWFYQTGYDLDKTTWLDDDSDYDVIVPDWEYSLSKGEKFYYYFEINVPNQTMNGSYYTGITSMPSCTWIINTSTGSYFLYQDIVINVTYLPSGNSAPNYYNRKPSDEAININATNCSFSAYIYDIDGDTMNISLLIYEYGSINPFYYNKTGITNGTWTQYVENLDYGIHYLWYFIITDEYGNSRNSPAWDFYTQSSPLNSPPFVVPLYPASGSNVYPELSFSYFQGVMYDYNFYVNFTGIVTEFDSTDSVTLEIYLKQPDDAYFDIVASGLYNFTLSHTQAYEKKIWLTSMLDGIYSYYVKVTDSQLSTYQTENISFIVDIENDYPVVYDYSPENNSFDVDIPPYLLVDVYDDDVFLGNIKYYLNSTYGDILVGTEKLSKTPYSSSNLMRSYVKIDEYEENETYEWYFIIYEQKQNYTARYPTNGYYTFSTSSYDRPYAEFWITDSTGNILTDVNITCLNTGEYEITDSIGRALFIYDFDDIGEIFKFSIRKNGYKNLTSYTFGKLNYGKNIAYVTLSTEQDYIIDTDTGGISGETFNFFIAILVLGVFVVPVAWKTKSANATMVVGGIAIMILSFTGLIPFSLFILSVALISLGWANKIRPYITGGD